MYIEALTSLEGASFVNEQIFSLLDALLWCMVEVSNPKTNSEVPVRDQLEALHDELKILRYYLLDPSACNPEANDPLLHVKAIVCDTACFMHSFHSIAATMSMVHRRVSRSQLFLIDRGISVEYQVICTL